MSQSQIVARVLITVLSTIFIQIDEAESDPLFLTPLLNNGRVEEARRLAQVDSAQLLGIDSYSGFLTVKPQYDSNLFFWYFPHEDPRAPLIIYLNGGPGVSSLIGLFNLVGPVKVEQNLTLSLRELTWSENYSLLFIDQPVGAGFSFTNNKEGYTTSEDDVGSQLYTFLVQFIVIFPEVKDAPLFLAGQSYAGKYIPAFAFYIHRGNRASENLINLKGIVLGNPLIDIKYMFPNYNKLMQELSFMNGNQLKILQCIEEQGLRFIEEGRMVDASNKFNETIEYIKKKTGVNIYNFLNKPGVISAPVVEEYLNRPDIRKLIHVGNASFDLNNQLVYQYMLPDISNSTKPFIEELLENYGVIIYSGQLDLIIPHGLTKRVIDKLQWSKRSMFENAPRRKIIRNDTVVAYKQSGGGLTEAVVRNAGHMVPVQVPDVMMFLLDSFIREFS